MQTMEKTYAGWTEYDVKEKCWQVFTLGGEVYIKTDFYGNFINVKNDHKVVSISDIFHLIRNCTDSEGYIIAKRKKIGSPLWPVKNKRRLRMPI
ncbi:hypothetical protein [Heyndrickxia sporothermodurans]|uniref:hypothetical protein n=1 Tax=Heyndrickxia sporothermodurans TaxID=46224 RepID=UPI0035DBD479